VSKKSRRRFYSVEEFNADFDRASRFPVSLLARRVLAQAVERSVAAPVPRSRVRQVLPVRPRSKGGRLRTFARPLTVSAKSLAQMPHGTRRQAVSCVSKELASMRQVQGSGKGSSRKSRSRNEQRRQIIQAARRRC